jgi:hypothetical protein
MAPIKISRGLRKLEFDPVERNRGESTQARVEFARPAPLQPGETVHIPLGMRDGRLRAVVGVPQLIEKKAAAESRQHEYVYRLSGLIDEVPPRE